MKKFILVVLFLFLVGCDSEPYQIMCSVTRDKFTVKYTNGVNFISADVYNTREEAIERAEAYLKSKEYESDKYEWKPCK